VTAIRVLKQRKLGSVAASAQPPECISGGRVLPVNNEQAIALIHNASSAQNMSRAHITGTITKVNRDATYEVTLDGSENSTTVLAEVYSDQGYPIQLNLRSGQAVELCGYIDLNPFLNTGATPRVVFTHKMLSQKYESGFTLIDGELAGD
jgi:hypothetical protein